MKSPAFQFYPDDFLGSPAVAAMTHAEIGVYMLLLCFDWNANGLPEDAATLARMVKLPPKQFAKVWPALESCFPVRDGRRFNPRLEKERAKQTEWREKSARGGKHSAEKRAAKGKGGSTVVEPEPEPNGNTPVSSLQTPRKTKTPSGYSPEFERAFAAYPKRAGDNPKREAWGQWQASIKRGADPVAMEDGTHRYAKFCEATNLLNTPYVKQGATFYGRNESWLDPWDIPLQVSRGGAKREPEPQYDDPNAPGYVGILPNGELSPMMRRMSQPRAS